MQKAVVDCSTGETTMVDLTPEELEQQARDAEEGAAMADMLARSERDMLLAASDWTQLPDVPEATRKKWAPYRQKLRDNPTGPWPKPPKA